MPPGIEPPAPGGMNHAGRLVTRASIGVKPPFSSRPEKRSKKSGSNPHGYCPHAALLSITSLRTFRLLGGMRLGRARRRHTWRDCQDVFVCLKPNHHRELR
jgi:hypothetical protein